jgi:hypothetical protein
MILQGDAAATDDGNTDRLHLGIVVAFNEP